MKPLTIALFGESERGEFKKGYYCQSLSQLSDCLGEPVSKESLGVPLAIRCLLSNYSVLFFRVHEEGFSRNDYLFGLKTLQNKSVVPTIAALCLPGVGDGEIIQASDPICSLHKSLLILSASDFYDYLTY